MAQGDDLQIIHCSAIYKICVNIWFRQNCRFGRKTRMFVGAKQSISYPPKLQKQAVRAAETGCESHKGEGVRAARVADAPERAGAEAEQGASSAQMIADAPNQRFSTTRKNLYSFLKSGRLKSEAVAFAPFGFLWFTEPSQCLSHP